MRESSNFRCLGTACKGQWLYLIDEQGIVYSELENQFVGLDATGVLAYRVFDAGSTVDELRGHPAAAESFQTLHAIFALSRGKFPEEHGEQQSEEWPLLKAPQAANVKVNGLPLLIEVPGEVWNELCRDCFVSCTATTQPARFHIRISRAGDAWTVLINEREVFPVVQDTQLGLGLLHAVRTLLYDEAQYDVAFHAAMVANDEHGILLCAPRECGKSTLAAYLAANGFALVSDEPSLLCLDTICISPVEMPISLKEGAWNILATEWPQLTDARIHTRSDGQKIKLLHPSQGGIARTPKRLTHIIFPRYSASSSARVEALSPIQQLALLNEGGMLLGRRLNKDIFERFLSLMCATPAFAIYYSSLQQAEQMVQRILSDRVAQPPAKMVTIPEPPDV